MSQRSRRAGRTPEPAGSWSRWNAATQRRYTVGVEEEVMLLDRSDSLGQRSGEVLTRLSAPLATHASAETHAAVVELTTGIHQGVRGAHAELTALRGQLAKELRKLDLRAASAGMHPTARPENTQLTTGGRYSIIADSMRALAHREPTMALHVHIGVPDPEDATRLLNGLRRWVPVLLALSANSPFHGDGDSGFASLRTAIFQGFPRTGLPRSFAGYADYVGSVEPLLTSGAVPDPTFLWWDVRLQPGLGTVEVRVMDAQTTVTESCALVALVQSLARHELEDSPVSVEPGPEVLGENRFLAARDGVHAQLIDTDRGRLVPVRELVDSLIVRCRPHAEALGCLPELEQIQTLAAANGADRQRAWIATAGEPTSLVSALAQRFESAEGPGAMLPLVVKSVPQSQPLQL